MAVDVMRERGMIINSAAQAMSSGIADLETFPLLVVRIVKEEMWRQRAIPQRRWELSKEFTHFEEFVEAQPLDGLGTTVADLKVLCAKSIVALDAIDRACKRPQGRPLVNFDNVQDSPTGNSQAAALRRLRSQRPDLHERVISGELSANAAAVEAGFRRKMISVPGEDMQALASSLVRKLSPEQLAELVGHLTCCNTSDLL